MSASGLGFTAKSFELLDALDQEANNCKEWYDAHREEIHEKLIDPFAALLRSASETLTHAELPLKGGEETMFRMNRDVRFSKDKRPYKHSVAGMLTPSGTKAESSGVVYIEIASGGGWIGGGFYKPSTSDLNAIRDRMIDWPEAFDDVLRGVHRRDLAFDEMDPVKTMPRGYSQHVGHRHAKYLKLRNLLLRTDLPKSCWLYDSVTDRLVDHAKACMGLIQFGRH